MIEITQDITTVQSGIIGHQVNCLGYMNSGVAKTIREKWPHVYNTYKSKVDFHERDAERLLGRTQVIYVDEKLAVANIFGQSQCGYDGKQYTDLESLNKGLWLLFQHAYTKDMDVYLPLIGCGLGGANWERDVKPMIEALEHEFPTVQCTICLYPPQK